jgi:general secretion pathway protein K
MKRPRNTFSQQVYTRLWQGGKKDRQKQKLKYAWQQIPFSIAQNAEQIRMHFRKNYPISDNRGAALLITLLIIATLTGLTLAFSEDSSTELSLAGYSKNGYRAYQIARSGVDLALALLDEDEDRDVDSLSEDWALFDADSFPEQLPEEISLTARITDENSKININSLKNEDGEIDEDKAEQLSRLFSVLGLRESYVNSILDWLDSDDIERMDGAESYYYQTLEPPYECFNDSFLTVGQVFMVKGLENIRHFGENQEKSLLDYITVYSNGQININTASIEILQSLDDAIDESVAQSIIDYRSQESFSSVDDLGKVASIDSELLNRIREKITVKSSHFTIEMKASCSEAVSHLRAVVVRVVEESELISWQVI